ncbi:MAG: ribosomal protein S6 [Flavobacteriaceae bacterium]|jgi:ribosomal protein S6
MTEQKKATCYELSYLFIPTIDEAKASAAHAALRALIDEKGSFTVEGESSTISLAYSMRKNINNEYKYFDEAYFGWIRFEADSSVADEIHDKAEKLPEALRILMVKASANVVEYIPEDIEEDEYADKKEVVAESATPVVEVLDATYTKKEEEKVDLDADAVDKGIDTMVADKSEE